MVWLLGWKAASDVENGVALVARYGFTDERWQQLDTSHNKVPSDTAWVLRAAVCTEATCRRTLLTYVAHWYATGPAQQTTYGTQARQTLDFMQATSEGKPHVLIGDLNVWTAPGAICRQTPNGAEALETLAAAKNIDAWRSVHGDRGRLYRDAQSPGLRRSGRFSVEADRLRLVTLDLSAARHDAVRPRPTG